MLRRTRLHSSSRSSEVRLPVTRVRSVVANGRDVPQWYVDALPWALRGGVDRALGGEGRRWSPPGRDLLEAGDHVGFWRVIRSTGRELLLRAEVRAPGTVELRTTFAASGDDHTTVAQTVSLDPSGLPGQLYLLADLPAREAVIELAHRRLLRELRRPD